MAQAASQQTGPPTTLPPTKPPTRDPNDPPLTQNDMDAQNSLSIESNAIDEEANQGQGFSRYLERWGCWGLELLGLYLLLG